MKLSGKTNDSSGLILNKKKTPLYTMATHPRHDEQENLDTNEQDVLDTDEEPAPVIDLEEYDLIEARGGFFSMQRVYIGVKEYFEEKNIPPEWI